MATKKSVNTDQHAMSQKEVLAARAAKTPKEAATTDKEKKLPEGWKEPKNLAVAADQLFGTRNKRLALQKEVDKLQELETALSNHLINNLSANEASGIAGKLCRVSVTKRDVPRAEDWSQIYAYLVADYQKKKKVGMQDGAFALLQRRLGDRAVAEMWEAGKAIPGVGKFTVTGLSINKV